LARTDRENAALAKAEEDLARSSVVSFQNKAFEYTTETNLSLGI
jgi:hypothetical protein